MQRPLGGLSYGMTDSMSPIRCHTRTPCAQAIPRSSVAFARINASRHRGQSQQTLRNGLALSIGLRSSRQCMQQQACAILRGPLHARPVRQPVSAVSQPLAAHSTRWQIDSPRTRPFSMRRRRDSCAASSCETKGLIYARQPVVAAALTKDISIPEPPVPSIDPPKPSDSPSIQDYGRSEDSCVVADVRTNNDEHPQLSTISIEVPDFPGQFRYEYPSSAQPPD